MDHPDERVLDLSASIRAAHERRATATRPGSIRSGPDPGSEQLARARTSFLVDEPLEPGVVREPILASWTRSRHFDVDADRIDLPHESDISMDSLLTRAAGPIFREVADQLVSEPVSLILTDADGVVLDRRSGDGGLTHHLDRIWLAPGFSYAERYVGTNGIGTALEGRGPAQVFGHEHYAEHLEDLACAGAPIRHPVSGKVLGVVDLTCWRSDANMMMVAIAATVAKRIEELLLEQSGHRELALLHDYLIACQRGRGAVFALSDDLLMMNDRARELFEPADQGPLLAEAGEVLKAGHRHQVLVDLPSGNTARVQCRPSWTEGDRSGGIVQVQLITNGAVPTPRVHTANPALPAAVGSGALWSKCCQAVDRHFRAREWLVLEGEPGTGKTTVARATHQGRTPAAHLRVLDADDHGPKWIAHVTEELESGGGTLVITHVDRLGPRGVQELCDVLDEHSDTTDPERPWVVATVTAGTGSPEHLGELLAHFPSTVEVPPLRHHVEDVAELVPYLIARLTRGAELTCSPEAMRVLMRNRWPGNVEQLYQVLRKVVAKRRTGVVGTADLPAECRAITRRVLTPLEAIECDAIVDALLDASGNKAEAARHLGMSRATIYRKIRGYGISMPTT